MENTDWSALGFDYRKTDYNVRYSFADGKWSDMVVTDDEYIQMHMSASCLHYGIELFEGLKAFRGVDGKVRLFRVADNARRIPRRRDYADLHIHHQKHRLRTRTNRRHTISFLVQSL